MIGGNRPSTQTTRRTWNTGWAGSRTGRLVAEAKLAEAQVAADLAAKEPKCCDRCGKKFDRSELHEYKCAEPGEWLRICKRM